MSDAERKLLADFYAGELSPSQLISAAIQQEREECARVADRISASYAEFSSVSENARFGIEAAAVIANDIRARGEHIKEGE